ncbi:MAG: potassium-transporting ATPase subunit KdpA [Candidatus Sumerlaeia bacterium]|nr:potassium-transporting ATPase subunit KdpA [Candidatus Sumerlaeia bacterium]
MEQSALLQMVLFLGVLTVVAVPLGLYMAAVYDGRRTWLSAILYPAERLLYRLAGVDPRDAMDWRRYATAVIVFSALGFVATYLLQRVQHLLPLNPAGMPAVAPHSALNVAVSFVTNTNWQNYGGEATMGYLVQMLVLTVQNFVSAATGMAVLVALARGIMQRESTDLGNFWVDLARGTLHILLPLSLVFALFLVSQGVVQTFAPYAQATTLEGETQTIALGPAASQIAIKQLGTNGGGFFNANSAHPLENPTPLSNFLQMLAILLIPAALCHTFGKLVGDRRQGWILFGTMAAVFLGFLTAALWAEAQGNPALDSLGLAGVGNMEGKETRFGVGNSVLWGVATTAASNGSVNAMHDSFSPLAGMALLLLMQLGEVIFGGVGSGLYGLLIFVILSVFVAGLMVGRTPEYLGKKIGPFEMKMAAFAVLLPSVVVLTMTALGVLVPSLLDSRSNPGPHGLSQVLYAFTSQANNNGSAFGGLSANEPLYNYLGALAMWIGRFGVIVPVLAIAGSLARKKHTPPSPGTLPTHTPLFAALLIGVLLTVGALTFVPVLALGPVVEHLSLKSGR